MHDCFFLLQCVGRAVVRNVYPALYGRVPFGDGREAIAAGAFQEYGQHPGAVPLPAALEALAGKDPEEVRPAAAEVASRELVGIPARVRQTLVAYLAQVPFAVRQALRRPADPGGTTAPAGLAVRVPQELARFLPAGLPRFQAGDQPLEGWELVELLGQGRLGEVWKARHRSGDGRTAVLKFILDPVAAGRLRSEVAVQEVLERVRRQGLEVRLVPLREAHPRAQPPCLVYDYLEGSDLAGLIREMHPAGKLTPEFVASLVQDLARALADAHRLDPPLVHGNLKPGNVLVRRGSDNRLSLHLADFGTGDLVFLPSSPEPASARLARRRALVLADGGGRLPLPASPPSTGRAPEPRDDVYALSVLWYQLATGSAELAALPPDWRDVVAERGLYAREVGLLEACLSPRVEDRPTDAGDLAHRLATLADPAAGRPEATPRPGEWTPVRRGRRPRSTPALGVPTVSLRSGPRGTERPGEIVSIWISPGVVMPFAWCPPGTFVMGSPPDEAGRGEDETQHPVTLTRGFYLGTHPVTQTQWRAVMGNNPSRAKAADNPVEMVSWDQCVEFCKRLRPLTGKGFRLPTEAEWEYACRAGTTTAYHAGEDAEALRQVGWCSFDDVQGSARGTQPVGKLLPNAWGLHDMHGNVWEWCRDWYGPYEGEEKDPLGPGFGHSRVLRGGSWFYGPRFCRSARRVRKEPPTRYADIGCRLVLCPD